LSLFLFWKKKQTTKRPQNRRLLEFSKQSSIFFGFGGKNKRNKTGFTHLLCQSPSLIDLFERVCSILGAAKIVSYKHINQIDREEREDDGIHIDMYCEQGRYPNPSA